MPLKINGFNVGQDLSLSIRDDRGTVVGAWQLGHMIDFDANADDVELKITPVTNGGLPLFDRSPNGWHGSINFVRADGTIANMFAAMDSNFYRFGRRTWFTMQTSILNRDGSVDKYSWTRCSFSRPKFGRFQADKEVDTGFNFRAQQMLNASGIVPLLVGVGV